MQSKVTLILALAPVLGIILGAFACNSDDESYTDEQLDFCAETGCIASYAYICGMTNDAWVGVCADNPDAAAIACQSEFVDNPYDEPAYLACPDDTAYGDETGGSDSETSGGSEVWDPSVHVSYNRRGQVYEIDHAFVQDLIEDHLAPLQNDTARLVLGIRGYYQLATVSPGDLAALLGLTSGDVLMSINGYNLGGFEGQMDAYQALQSETDFYLTVSRSTGPVTLHYELVE